MNREFRKFIDKINGKINSGGEFLVSFAQKTQVSNRELILQNFNSHYKSYFYWGKPVEKQLIIASEPLINFGSESNSNPPYFASNGLNLEKNFICNWKEFDSHQLPLIVGASKFSKSELPDIWEDFQNSNWFVPKILYYELNEDSFLIFNFTVNKNNLNVIESEYQRSLEIVSSNIPYDDAGQIKYEGHEEERISEKGFENWKEKINNSLKEISEGKISKVVISRRIEKELSTQPVISRILENLAEEYENCFIFAFKKSRSVFFGASPEKLITFNNGTIETEALAGSIKRGTEAKEDSELASRLQSDKKNIYEYLEVLEFIVETLKPYSDSLEYEKAPLIKKLPNIQHLWSPVKAKLKHAINIQEIVGRLHPTPAICGTPRNDALKLISELENYPRGLFSGIIGWYNFNMQGEFAIAIRSALIKDNRVYAYAGCGIVEGSEPMEEYEETKLKLAPILSIFENEDIYQS